MRLLATLLVFLTSGCIRSVGDIPGPGEGGFITGTVVQRDLQSGTFIGTSGVRVAALGTSITATTDDRGFFTLQRLPLGRVTVTVERRESDGTRSAARILDPVSVVVGGQTLDLGTIQLVDLAALEGSARIREPDSEPVGVGGTLVVVAQTQFKAITDQRGGYLVAGIPEGTFDVIAFRSGYSPARAPGVSAQSGLQLRVRDLVLPRQDQAVVVSVRGTVTKADTDDGSGVEASFTDETNPSAAPVVANTDATGAFTVDLPTGVYRATFTANGYRSVAIPGVAVLEEGVVGLSAIYLSLTVDGDLDGDGIPDAEDDDRDNDGCPNAQDSFPDDAFFCVDTDGDGLPDEIDTDDDDDGLSDAEEVSPGEDGFITNPLVADTDGDGFNDQDDVCPALANPGQDPEDCNDPGIEPGATPLIRSVFPTIGGPGTLVTLSGQNFQPQFPFHAVRFGLGPPAEPTVTNDNLLTVMVPYGSSTGTVALFVGGETATSTETFTVLEPPQLLEESPPSARVSEIVALFGRNYSVPDLRVTVDGVSFPQTTCPSEATGRAGGRDLICVQVPAGARSGTLRLESANGAAERQPDFLVLPGPIVTQIAPNPAEAGVPLTIYGFGLRNDDVASAVELEFSAAAGTVRSAVTVVSDSVALATVPQGAVTGPVRLIHPAGDTTAPRDLLILGPGDVAVFAVDPLMISEGDNLAITGRNLDNVTRVHFGGGLSAAPDSVSPSQVTVTVPTNVGPGTIEVESGGMRFSAPERSPVLQVVGPVRVLSAVSDRRMTFGGGYHQGQAWLSYRSVGGVQSIFTFDDQTMTVTGTLAAGFVGSGDLLFSFFVHPTLPFAVASSGGRTTVVDLPSLTTRGSCIEDAFSHDASSTRPIIFARNAPYAFIPATNESQAAGMLALTRVDLTTATCTQLGVQPTLPGSTIYRGVAFSPTQPLSSSGRLIVTTDNAIFVVASAPGAATDGDVVAGPLDYGRLGNQPFLGPNAQVAYFTGFANGGLSRTPLPPLTGGQFNIDGQIAGQVNVTANGRWALIALGRFGNSRPAIVDLATDRVVRRAPQHAIPAEDGRYISVHETLPRFLAGTLPHGRSTYRLTILE